MEETRSLKPDMKKPTLVELCRATFYIGTVGYGGPAILALMKRTLVDRRKWISEREFMNALSLAQILPGATGVSVMGYIGFKLHKLWGGILAPLFYILPATVAMTTLAWAYFRFGNISFVKALFAGLGALVVALLLNATWILGRSVFKRLDARDIKGLVISLTTFVGIYFLNINIVWLIFTAGLLGFVLFYFTREFEGERAASGEALLSEPRALEREPLGARDFVPVVAAMGVLGLGLLLPSTRALLTTFLSIGALAFGGGFTSIPLIQHQVVDAHAWLTVKQFLDGIALGQITPGPVFITATFVGYHVAVIAGALFATLAIFTPSLTAMIALADVHARVQNLKIVKVVVKGFLSGFIGLLIAVTLRFAFKSLVSWQAWLIFVGAVVWLIVLKRDSAWAILGTIALSLLIFQWW
jgi:chromate transporter